MTVMYESKWRDTLTLLHYYIVHEPDNWKLHTRLGNEWIEREMYGQAIDEFTKAVSLNPRWAENHLNLGRAPFTVGRYDEARLAFTAALGQTPDDWRGHVLLGITLARQNDPESGLEELAIAARLAPQAAEVHFRIANIHAEQGRGYKGVQEDPAPRSALP